MSQQSSIIRMTGELKLLAVWTCACGATATGQTERFSVDGEGLDEALAQIKAKQPKEFPYGWASFWTEEGTKYKCPACLKIRSTP